VAGPRRASMREGPLAALFRKTEDEALNDADAGAPQVHAEEPRDRVEPQAAERPQATRPSAPPHPALSASAPAPEQQEMRIPSPQERLRHAFSSEIPESLMERAALGRPLERELPEQYPSPPRIAGQPVIRVVGVGGGGVNAVNRMVEAEVEGIEFVAVNTDVQSLQQSTADITLHIGA
jgi:cell division protein FtsZ